MGGTSGQQAAAARLWQEHVEASFPAGLRGTEPGGIDMVWLDAAVAGCVSTWLSSGGSLDAGRMQILREGVADLDHVVRVITRAEELRYTRRLRELAVLIVGNEAPPAG
ncbi:hypothetical protein [Streptomyces sp. NPDC096934]|uniref:hypothetical protein n=1 Tax=Streptomyces sp. NPDC096934 TaxID=3155551 RepID=UPI0033187351